MPVNPLFRNQRVEVGQIFLIAFPPIGKRLLIEGAFSDRFQGLIPNTITTLAKIKHF